MLNHRYSVTVVNCSPDSRRAKTGTACVDYDVWVHVPQLDRDPSRIQRLYRFEDFDFRLGPVPRRSIAA